MYKLIFITAMTGVALLARVGMAGSEHDYYPRIAIKPELGAAGDFSDTYRYWRDAATIKQHAGLQADDAEAWKLNGKNMDVVEEDFHPGDLAVDAGQALIELWERREPGFKACLRGAAGSLEGMAVNYPQFDAKLKRVMTLEGRVEHCAKTVLWENFKQGTPENVNITTYLKSLSNGLPLDMKLDAEPMKAAYKRGEDLFYKRVGQLNFACASCHTPGSVMGNRLRGEVPSTPFGDAAHFPTYRSPAGEVEVLHKRFMRCLKQMRAKPLPPGDPAYVDLEVFYTAISNGYPIKVPSIR